MTETVRRSLVRPVFMRWSLLAFALLIPVVVHAGWDYVEARRFRQVVAEIRGRGEPVTLGDIRTRPAKTEAFRSDRYYRAAAVLASNRPQEQGFFERVRDAAWKGEWAGSLAEETRRQVGDREDALQLLDRAAPLTFEGFSNGTEGASLALFPLARLAGLRTMLLAFDGDGDHAAASLYAELRLRLVVEWAWPIFRAPIDEVDRVGRVLSSTHPTSAALSGIGRALVDLDRDDALKMWFLRRRAALFNSTFGPGPFPNWAMNETVFDLVSFRGAVLGRVLGQPWLERQMRRRAETLSTVIAALDQPWPERAGAAARVYEALSSPPSELLRRPDVTMSKQIVDDLALVRVARTVVAIERYRREHGETMPARLDDLVPGYIDAVPVDPYSGRRLLFRTEARSYAVYSLGPNRRDDSGDFTLLRFAQAARESRDLGMRIQYR